MDLRTTAWITADSANPRISAQVICHVIDPVIDSACRIAWIRLTSYTSRASNRNNTPRGYKALCLPYGLSRRPRRLAYVSTGKAPGDPAAPAVELRGLVKRYGQIAAVDGLALTAARGEVTGILGPNGAGKTTTIEIFEGYRRPDRIRCTSSGWTRYDRRARWGRGRVMPSRWHSPVGTAADT